MRLLGRSYLAFVLAPEPPFNEWLAELDARLLHQSSFFSNRPVILDLAALSPTMAETQHVIAAVESRGLRLVAVEGVNADWVSPRLAPLPGTPMPIGVFNPNSVVVNFYISVDLRRGLEAAFLGTKKICLPMV